MENCHLFFGNFSIGLTGISSEYTPTVFSRTAVHTFTASSLVYWNNKVTCVFFTLNVSVPEQF